jgi:hypothetical protein
VEAPGHVVPVVKLEEFLLALRVDERADNLLLAVLSPNRLLADEAHAAALAAFFVDESGDARQHGLVADFVLVAANDPGVGDPSLGYTSTK